MTAGEGGMIITDDPDLEQRCQSIVNCGRRRPGDSHRL
jgi:dTDP-4-amino-4,6-dideoxygalactose transaminase